MTVDVWADWRELAACRDDPDRQFPSHNAEEIAAAKRVCGGCAVRSECLRDAMELDEREGVWGGLTYAERRKHLPLADCARCGRTMPVDAKGMLRHNRYDGRRWVQCHERNS